MKRLLVSLFVILLTMTINAQAATYFVSPQGNNANPGTQAQPWKTLTYSVAKLQPGDTLYALSGTYAETVWVGNSGTATNPITIAAYTGQQPIIDGSTISVGNWASLLSLAGNYISVSGFQIQNINNDGYGGLGGSTAIQGGYGVSISGTYDTVNNLTVHNTWAQGILASGDNSTIENSTIYYVAMSNCRLSGQPNCSTASRGWASCVSAASPYNSGKITHNAVISHNTIYNCWGEGLSTWLSDGTIIEDNVVYDNWAQNLYVNNAVNALVQRNIVYNTPDNYVGATAGFSLADEVANNTPSLNQLSANNVVINNLVLNSPFSAFGWTLVSGSGLNNVVIANNTIVNLITYPNDAGFSTGSSSNGGVVNTGSSIVNNIVVGSVSVPSNSGLTFSNNLWSTSPPATARSATDVIGNPQLASTGGTGPGQLSPYYFVLLSGSPAFYKGKVVSQVTHDYFGTVSASPPDIGATE